MTAEIIVLNRGAIAIAADSAVTVSGDDHRNKVFNSANKLMMLSEHAPVAAMIYNHAELLGLPWETLIKTFRSRLGRTTLPTLDDYANELVVWLSNQVRLHVPTSSQTAFEDSVISSAMTEVRDRGFKRIHGILSTRPALTRLAVQRALASEIRKFSQAIRDLPFYDGWNERAERSLRQEWSARIDDLRSSVFEQLPLSDTSIMHLRRIGIAGLTRFGGPAPTTGLVVAGFGDDQIFPVVMSCRISGAVNGKIRRWTDPDRSIVGNGNTGGMILPFAQSEMVATFVEGQDPRLNSYIRTLLSKTLIEVPAPLVSELDGLNPRDAKRLEASLKAKLSRVYTEVSEGMTQYQQSNHVDPVLDMVSHMPKEELASLAGALVSLTSLKRKVTMVTESVGGPVDVAVLSKGDGFVWIRRKHYFDQSLNPRFIARYYEARQGGPTDG